MALYIVASCIGIAFWDCNAYTTNPCFIVGSNVFKLGIFMLKIMLKKIFLPGVFLCLYMQDSNFAAKISMPDDQRDINIINDTIEIEDPGIKGLETRKNKNNKIAIGATIAGTVGAAGLLTTALLVRQFMNRPQQAVSDGSNLVSGGLVKQFNGYNLWFFKELAAGQKWHNEKRAENSPYIQKVSISGWDVSEVSIILIGDLHCRTELLGRILTKLRTLNYFDENWHLAPNTYLVFLGDYCSRGEKQDEVEVLKKVLKLKNNNTGNVFLLKGNMDNPKDYSDIRYFPSALYFNLQYTDGKRIVAQCSHGGFQSDVTPENLENFLNSDANYKQIDSDSEYLNVKFTSRSSEQMKIELAAFKTGCDACTVNFQNFLLFRGHDHSTHGCKVYDESCLNETSKLAVRDKHGAWMDFKTTNFVEQSNIKNENGYARYEIKKPTTKTYPIYTLSAAAGDTFSDKNHIDLGKECFAIFHPTANVESSYLEVFEKE